MTKQAIIHVEDTENVIDLAKYLSESGWTIYSANKTEELLKKNHIAVTREQSLSTQNSYVAESTSLVRRILLTRYKKDEYDSSPYEDNNIFLLCMNVIPTMHFSVHPEKLEKITSTKGFLITSLLRCAYINHENILILTDPADYQEAIIQLRTDNITDDFRTYVAAKALNLVSAFDGGFSASVLQTGKYNVKYLDYLMYPFKKDVMLSSGSNSHQTACLYRSTRENPPLSDYIRHSDKSINYNNVSDIALALSQVINLFATLKNQYSVKCINCDGYEFTSQFTPLSGTVFTIIVKLNSIVGASLSSNVLDSFKMAYTYDTENIKNATLACSAVIDGNAAKEMVNSNLSTIVAPSFTVEAKQILSKNKNLKLIPSNLFSNIPLSGALINGGLILQQRDDILFDKWIIKTKNRPSQIQSDEMAFAMLLAKAARSYSVVLSKDNSIVGISQGVPSTVKAVKLALFEATEYQARQSVAADKKSETDSAPAEQPAQKKQNSKSLANILVCDGVLNFNDDIKKLIDCGINAILQTGGSPSDGEFIKYCDEHDVAMVFTGMTHILL